MSMKYLLDTNVLSEPLRPKPNPAVLAKLKQHRHEIATASVVWHELLFGCQRLPVSRKRERIEQYLHEVVEPHLPILPYSQEAAAYHAEERARLTSEGKPPSFADGQIAAIANVNGLIIVTANVSDYQNFRDLSVEDWSSPDNKEEIERQNTKGIPDKGNEA